MRYQASQALPPIYLSEKEAWLLAGLLLISMEAQPPAGQSE